MIVQGGKYMYGQSTGIVLLTAYSPRLIDEPEIFLHPFGVDESIPLAILGLNEKECPVYEVVGDRRWDMNVEKMQDEIVTFARRLVDENPDVGAIVLECSDFPSFAAAIQEEVKLPVFDYIGMINMVHHAVVQKRYSGFI